MSNWRILVVDDENDVHTVTRLALRRRLWKGKGLDLVSAHSAEQAKKTLAETTAFHVALVDVVMETDHAGLELCEYIRATQPRWTRIILRTGQPGAAPEEQVLNDYDIDYYMSKADFTQDRIYATARAALRSSQDIATLLTVGAQLEQYVRVLRQKDSAAALFGSFSSALTFLESKYDAGVALFVDFAEKPQAEAFGAEFEKMVAAGTAKLAEVREAAKVDTNGNGADDVKPKRVNGSTVVFPSTFRGPGLAGSIAATFRVPVSDHSVAQVVSDLLLFAQNWKVACELLADAEKPAS